MAIIQILLLIDFFAYFNMGSSFFINFVLLSSLALVTPIFIGPLFFYYIKTIYEKNFRFSPSDYLSFLPFFISIVVFSIPFLMAVQNNNESIIKYLVITPLLGVIYFIYYIFNSFKIIRKFRRLLVNNYASIVEKDLKWISIWAKGLVLLLILDFLAAILMGFGIDFKIPLLITAIYLTGLILYLGYHGIYQNEVFLVSLPDPTTKNNDVLYSLKDEKEIALLTDQLEKLFKEDKIFLENSISLKHVADRLRTTDKKLSELINTSLNSNFYEFVNNYRINEFIESVEKGDTEKLTLLSIAFESGFNSKASFNRIFKKRKGITPSQFVKKIQEKEVSIGLTASNKSI